MAESRFASSDEIVVDQLKLNAKNRNTTKSRQRTWLNVREKWVNERKLNPKLEEYEHEDLDKKLQMLYAEVRTKDGFFYNFVENIINKNCMIARAFRDTWSLVMILKSSNCTRLRLV